MKPSPGKLFIIFYFVLLSCLDLTAVAKEKFSCPSPLQKDKQKPALLIKAESSYDLRKFDLAIQYCQAALKTLKVDADAEYVVAACNLLGASYIKMRSFDEALDAINRGLKVANSAFGSFHPLIADCNFHLGTYYDLTGNVDASIAHHEKALEIRKKYFGSGHLKVAESMVGLGEVYLFNGLDLRKASAFFQQAVQIREVNLRPDHLDLYTGYFYMAQVNKRLGDNDKALIFAFKALSVVNSRKEYHSYLEKCYTLLGDIYYAQADFGKAIEYLKTGIEQSTRTDGPLNFNLIRKYINIGVAYYEINQTDRAVACFRKSLHIYAQHHHHNAALKAENFLHLGRVFQKSGRLDSARYFIKRCLDSRLTDYGPKHFLTSESYRYLAELFQKSGENDSAALYIQKSLIAGIDNFNESNIHINPAIGEIARRYDLFHIFGHKASILLDLYADNQKDNRNLTSALACLKIADTLMTLNRNSYQHEGSKLFFADHYHPIYEKALQTSYLLYRKTGDRKYVADALMFMEKSKALLLAESLNKAEIFTQAGLPDSIRNLERKLNSALTAYNSQLETNNQKASPEGGQQLIRDQIFQVSQKQEKLQDTIARLYPSYFQVKYQNLSSLADIRDFAKKNNSMIIEYFWGEEKVFLLAISAKSLVFEEVTEVDSMKQNILQYFQSLQQAPSWKGDGAAFQTFMASAYPIYNKLVAPLIENENPERLIVIRDGPLLLIPFESLIVSKANIPANDFQQLDYLIRHHTVSYAHSADLLLKSSLRLKNKSNGNKVLAFSYSQMNPTQDVSASRAVNELPGAAREIQAISQILPGSFFLGEEATEQKFKAKAGDFDILHLAVHGKSDPEKQFSGTLFFKQSADGQDDGELHVYELYDLSLKARLTVLSACESGVGKFFRGEGVFSIARGFAYAGCPSTVMTLWPISDMTSAQIMADFYRELNKGEDIDEALRKAKLNYLESTDPKLAHPAYWAAYIPTGNMDAVVAARFSTRTALILVFVALTIGFLILKVAYFRKQHHPW